MKRKNSPHGVLFGVDKAERAEHAHLTQMRGQQEAGPQCIDMDALLHPGKSLSCCFRVATLFARWKLILLFNAAPAGFTPRLRLRPDETSRTSTHSHAHGATFQWHEGAWESARH